MKFCTQCGAALTTPPTLPTTQAVKRPKWSSGTRVVVSSDGMCRTPYHLLWAVSKSSTSVLPDVTASVRRDGGTERINNARDEYAPFVRQYGFSRSQSSRPRMIRAAKGSQSCQRGSPVMTLHHLKVAFAPIGCVDAYVKAARIIDDASRISCIGRTGHQAVTSESLHRISFQAGLLLDTSTLRTTR